MADGTPARVRRLFQRLASANPAPHTELGYATPYQLLVAVILSAQATDRSVNAATRGLFADAPTPGAMLRLGEDGLVRHINRIGLYRSKARHVLAMTQCLIDRHGGAVPSVREDLEALPGVGRKTANVVLNTVFGEPTIAVNTHVFRVANRTGLAPGTTVDAVEALLLRRVPRAFRANAHHWLLLHGRYVCKARRPDCPHCPIRDLCDWPDKT